MNIFLLLAKTLIKGEITKHIKGPDYHKIIMASQKYFFVSLISATLVSWLILLALSKLYFYINNTIFDPFETKLIMLLVVIGLAGSLMALGNYFKKQIFRELGIKAWEKQEDETIWQAFIKGFTRKG